MRKDWSFWEKNLQSAATLDKKLKYFIFIFFQL